MPASTTPTTRPAPTHVRASAADRRTYIAAIHAAGHALGMDMADQNPQSEYRSLLWKLTGRLSTIDMSVEQLQQVRKHLQGLQRHHGQGTMSQADLVQLLWKQLGELGALTDPSQAGLRSFMERHGQASHPRLMGPTQGRKVIEALKAWKARAKAGKP